MLALLSNPPGCRGCHCPHAVPTEGSPGITSNPSVCPTSTWVPGGRTSSLGTLPWDGDLHLCLQPDFPPLVCTTSTA